MFRVLGFRVKRVHENFDKDKATGLRLWVGRIGAQSPNPKPQTPNPIGQDEVYRGVTAGRKTSQNSGPKPRVGLEPRKNHIYGFMKITLKASIGTNMFAPTCLIKP